MKTLTLAAAAAFSLSFAGSAGAETKTMTYKLITMPVESAAFEAPGDAGHTVLARRQVGVAVFDDGRIAYKTFVNLIDSAGATGNYSGYSTYTFENGDSLTLSFVGDWGDETPGGDYVVIKGTGAFKGATGTGRFDDREDQPWDGVYYANGKFTLDIPGN